MAERMLKSEKGQFFIDGLRSDDRAHRLASLIRSPERIAEVISHGEGANRGHHVWIDAKVAEPEAREIADMLGIEFAEVR